MPQTTSVTTTTASAYEEGIVPLWSRGIFGQNVTVGLFDTGVNETDILTGRIERHINFTEDNSTQDDSGHGTQMAEFIVGYAPRVRIVSFKVVGSSGLVDRDVLTDALTYCAENHPDIRLYNVSLAIRNQLSLIKWCTRNKPCKLCIAVNRISSVGKLVIAASGNRRIRIPGVNRSAIDCPAIAEHAISVGALGGTRLKYSDYDSFPELPSQSASSGTSVSTALATGGLALLLSKFPSLTAELIQIVNDLTKTTTPGAILPTIGRTHVFRQYVLLAHLLQGGTCYPEAWIEGFEQGRSLRQAGNTRASIRILRTAIACFPSLQEAHNELGLAFADIDLLWAAHKALKFAIDLNWFNPIPHDNLAMVLQRMGRTEEALYHCNIALLINPGWPIAANRVWEITRSTH